MEPYFTLSEFSNLQRAFVSKVFPCPVSHLNKKTTYTDPRLAFAIEEKDNPDDFSQKFDSSTTALQVLHGRDLSGKVVVVTGGNSGIGYETCRALAFHGAHVVMASRDAKKSKEAIQRIVSQRVSCIIEGRSSSQVMILLQSSCKLEALSLDLESFASVRKFAEEFEALNL